MGDGAGDAYFGDAPPSLPVRDGPALEVEALGYPVAAELAQRPIDRFRPVSDGVTAGSLAAARGDEGGVSATTSARWEAGRGSVRDVALALDGAGASRLRALARRSHVERGPVVAIQDHPLQKLELVLRQGHVGVLDSMG